MSVPLENEAELKHSTKVMFQNGGVENVLDCAMVMARCQLVILEKLKELILLDKNNADPR